MPIAIIEPTPISKRFLDISGYPLFLSIPDINIITNDMATNAIPDASIFISMVDSR